MGEATPVYSTTLPSCVITNSTNASLVNSTIIPCSGEKQIDQTKQTVSTVLNYLVPILLAIIMIGIGCTVELKKLKKHFKNPTGILTGLLCQFIIMPALGYMWASIFSMEDPETLSLLLVGSCPGGTFSNIVAYWIDADMALSVTMTTVSIFVSIGMLPLLLYLYSLGFSNTSMKVPFDGLGISIALSICPLAIGIAIRYKWEKFARILARILAAIGLVVMVIALAFLVYTFMDMWKFHLGLFITAIFYPICGMILGYVISTIVSLIAKPLLLTHRQRRTVSIETGIQNGQIALSIVQLSGWSFNITGRAILFPIMYSIAQVIISFLYIILYHVIYCLRYGKISELQKQDDTITEKPGLATDANKGTADNSAFEMKEEG